MSNTSAVSLPSDIDRERWSPSEDKRGAPVHPGDYVSVPVYPRGTVRGILVVSERSWSVLPDGSKVLSLLVKSNDGTCYEATSKIRKLQRKPR